MTLRGMLLTACAILSILTVSLYTSSAFARSYGYGRILCKYDGFSCHRVGSGESWSSLFPDSYDRDIAMRVNRMNTNIYPGMVIAIPDNISSSDIMDFAPFPHRIQSPGEKVIFVDPNVNAWGAYDEDGSLVRWGPAAAGADYCPDLHRKCHTHPGSFRIYALGSSDCISHKFPLPRGGAPMPYCMYFNAGQALHGEPHGVPGFNASHGCVRLYVNDAEWLRYDFVEGPNASNGYRGTRVVIKNY